MQTAAAFLHLVVVGAGAWAGGNALLGRRPVFGQPILNHVLETALGLLILSHLVFLLVMSGLPLAPSLLILSLLLAAWGAWGLKRRGPDLRWWRGQAQKNWAVAAAAAAYGAWISLFVSLPPTAVDELTYHLEVPRRILQSGGMPFWPDNFWAYFPQLGEMLYLHALWAGGEAAARLIHALFGALTGAAIYGFARTLMPRPYALGAAALFLTVPSVLVLIPTAYVDLIFALYAFLALVLLLEFLKRPRAAVLLPLGAACGALIATKYTGIQFLLLLLVILLIERLRTGDPRLLPAAVWIPALAFLVAVPYFLRNLSLTGWPLFPFDLGFFELSQRVNWDGERSRLLLLWLSGYGASTDAGLLADLTAPIRVFWQGTFGDTRRFDGMAGPVFLLTPLLLLLRPPRLDEIRPALILVLLFLGYWTITTQQVRFLLPVLPMLSVILLYGVQAARGRLAVVILAVGILANLTWGLREQLHLTPSDYWTGRQSRREYLSARVVGYPLYQEANQRLGRDDLLYLVNMRNFGYLLDCRWRADFLFEYFRLAARLGTAAGPADVAAFFRDQQVTHLMIDEPVTLSPHALGPLQQDLLRRFLKEHGRLLVSNPRRPGQKLYRLVWEGPKAS